MKKSPVLEFRDGFPLINSCPYGGRVFICLLYRVAIAARTFRPSRPVRMDFPPYPHLVHGSTPQIRLQNHEPRARQKMADGLCSIYVSASQDISISTNL